MVKIPKIANQLEYLAFLDKEKLLHQLQRDVLFWDPERWMRLYLVLYSTIMLLEYVTFHHCEVSALLQFHRRFYYSHVETGATFYQGNLCQPVYTISLFLLNCYLIRLSVLMKEHVSDNAIFNYFVK